MGGIYVINLTSVGIFGMILSASFCDISWTQKKRLLMSGSMAGVLMIQGIIYFEIDSGIVEYFYPLITHVPLAVVLCILSKSILWPVISVFTAYLCCQLRRWLALLIVWVFAGGSLMQDVSELILTLPLLLVLIKFIAPSLRTVSHHRALGQWLFGLVPGLYYGFDYLTRIYTNLLMEGVLVAVEFMPFVCSVAYLIFAVHISEEGQVRSRLEQTQYILKLQISQAVTEIEALRESWEKTRRHRHDLRHHMQYISSCIENGRYEQAQEYIHGICWEIETAEVTAYCENEAANLIFSAFAGRAKAQDIPIKIKARIPKEISVSESDLCVLLSNALENALHACQKQKEKGLPGWMEADAYEKNGTFVFQLANSCDGNVVLKEGIPVAEDPEHGIGVRSICAIVEQYGGIHTFMVEGDKFILRTSL